MKHSLAAFILALSCVFLAAAAAASPPSPYNSSSPHCFLACPGGDMPDTVIARSYADTPLAGRQVEFDWCACPDFELCAPNGTEAYTVDANGCLIRGQYTDANGMAVLRVRGGGVCPTGNAAVRVDGITLGLPPIVSPDQNGDLVVEVADEAIAASKLGTADSTADFDCDGIVTEADLAILEQHLGHSSLSVLGVSDPRGVGLELAAAVPNPFTRGTRIGYAVPVAGQVRLAIFDLLGRRVATLVSGLQEAGAHMAAWDGRDRDGHPMGAGVYMVRLDAAGQARNRVLVLMR